MKEPPGKIPQAPPEASMSLQALPEELLQQVAAELDPEAAARLGASCRHARNALEAMPASASTDADQEEISGKWSSVPSWAWKHPAVTAWMPKRLSVHPGFEQLRELVLEDVAVPPELSQLVNLRFLELIRCGGLENVSALAHLPTLVLNDCDEVPEPSGLRFLDLYDCGAESLPSLPELRRLELKYCDRIAELPRSPQLQWLYLECCFGIGSLPHLPQLQRLHLLVCYVGEFPHFPHLQRLQLVCCDNIAELPHFPHLQWLHLKKCKHITELPHLPQLQSLILDEARLADISSLAGLRFLRADWCPEVEGIPELTQLRTLILRKCAEFDDSSEHQPVDLSRLVNLRILHLHQCHSVVGLPALTNLHTLELIKCWGLVSLPKLTNLHILEVHLPPRREIDCPGLAGLTNLRRLTLVRAKSGAADALALADPCLSAQGNAGDISGLSKLRSLTLNDVCAAGVSSLASLRFLELDYSQATTTAVPPRLHTLVVKNRSEFDGLAGLRELHTLVLKDCEPSADLSSLSALRKLQVEDEHPCRAARLVGIPALTHLHTLKLSRRIVPDLSRLTGLHRLTLYRCRGTHDGSAVVDISPLGNQCYVELAECYDDVRVARSGTLFLNLGCFVRNLVIT
jgi:Leucine-rich repeat (LRR) protein